MMTKEPRYPDHEQIDFQGSVEFEDRLEKRSGRPTKQIDEKKNKSSEQNEPSQERPDHKLDHSQE